MKIVNPPEWVHASRPHLRRQVIGPPPGQEDHIGSLEALVGVQDGWPVIYVYAQLEQHDARLRDNVEDHVVELCLLTNRMVPISLVFWPKAK